MNTLEIFTHPVDVLRAFNAVIALVATVMLIIRINDDWHTISRGWRLGIIGLALYPATVTYGSIEQLVQGGSPFGWRTLLITVASLTTIAGLVASRRRPPPPRATSS